MKNIYESEETFGAAGEIGYCYWRLREIYKEMNKPIAPIDRMIDQATGFDKKQEEEHKQEIINLLETIITNKKILEDDFSKDLEMLEMIKK